MADLFDKLGNFFKSIFSDDDASAAGGQRKYYDDDMQDAWDELEDYLNEGKTQRAKTRREEHSQSREQPRREQVRQALKDDYANLKVPFGASFEAVKQAYKKLLRQYHPDKHANDPAKVKMATEITSKINQSFQRIREFEEKTK